MTAKEYTTNYITILDVNKEQDDQEEETNHIEPMATIKTADTLSSQFQTKEQNLRFFAGGVSIIIFISFILCLYWDEFATQTLTIPIEDYSDGCLCAGETIEIVCGWNGKSPSSDDLIEKEIDKIFCDSCSSLSYNHTVFTVMVLLFIILSMTLVLIGGFMQCFGTHFEWLIKKACHYQKPCKWFSTIIYVISFIAALGLIVFMYSNEDCPVFNTTNIFENSNNNSSNININSPLQSTLTPQQVLITKEKVVHQPSPLTTNSLNYFNEKNQQLQNKLNLTEENIKRLQKSINQSNNEQFDITTTSNDNNNIKQTSEEFHLFDGYRVGKSLTGAICATILLFIVIFIDAYRKKYVG